MKEDVKNSFAEIEITVTEEMTATLAGKKIHPVYSTFWLAYHAELAARKAIEDFFDEGENAVGGELYVKHEAMAAVGEKIFLRATVSEVMGRKIICTIEAKTHSRIIASGFQTQIVLPQTKIDGLIEEANERKNFTLQQ